MKKISLGYHQYLHSQPMGLHQHLRDLMYLDLSLSSTLYSSSPSMCIRLSSDPSGWLNASLSSTETRDELSTTVDAGC